MPSPNEESIPSAFWVQAKINLQSELGSEWDADREKVVAAAMELWQQYEGPLVSDYPGVPSVLTDGSGWNRYRAEGERRLNDMLEFAEKHQLTFRFRRHGSGQHWMIECQGPDPIDGVVEHVFDEKHDMSWPLQQCIEVLKIAQHGATLKEKNTPRPPSSD